KRMPADCRRRREESLTKNPKAGNRNESRDLDSYKTKLRNSKLSWLFSGIHFGMDDWGNWRLNFI
ncbi:MAG: hypothetical protein ACLPYZ_18040, partial [Limisphaerales bacterium]